MARPFLRIRGHLKADGTFEAVHGGETGRLARRCVPDPSLSLQLLDDSGAVVARGPVERQSLHCGIAEQLRSTDIERVIGYVVLHPRATTLVVHDGTEILHCAPIAPDKPRIHRLRVHADRDIWQIYWDAEHSQPLSFDLFFIDPLRHVIAVAKALQENSFSLDTSPLPGGGDCHIALVATDGIRSQCARSKLRRLPSRPPILTILAPANDEILAAGQPFSLMGNSHDLAGRALPASGITWSIDGTTTASGNALALGTPLRRGDHTIEMSYRESDQIVATARHHITVVTRPIAANPLAGDQ
ncbi:hypothetical protein [Nocardia abscessus]|uniref:hypothetical protein n=1 Tax=Nocardia abscessus TaxID=120957 RepID=UPI0024574BED|nr:hypothetical protein [Nocardia abscessus]